MGRLSPLAELIEQLLQSEVVRTYGSGGPAAIAKQSICSRLHNSSVMNIVYIASRLEFVREGERGWLFTISKMTPRIIAFTGEKFSGKDTAASIDYGYCSVGRLAFADPLKRCVMAMCDFTYEQVYRELKDVVDPRYGKIPRYYLQDVGTEYVREQFGKDHWVNLLEQKLIRLLEADEHDVIFITDVRYDNEAEMLRRYGAEIVKIVRNKKRGEGEVEVPKDTHASEQGISAHLIHHVIQNHTDVMQDLFDKVDSILCPMKRDYMGC